MWDRGREMEEVDTNIPVNNTEMHPIS